MRALAPKKLKRFSEKENRKKKKSKRNAQKEYREKENRERQRPLLCA